MSRRRFELAALLVASVVAMPLMLAAAAAQGGLETWLASLKRRGI